MLLATKCPHFKTTFRVAKDQLKLQSGLVRCGVCQEVFNGIENILQPSVTGAESTLQKSSSPQNKVASPPSPAPIEVAPITPKISPKIEADTPSPNLANQAIQAPQPSQPTQTATQNNAPAAALPLEAAIEKVDFPLNSDDHDFLATPSKENLAHQAVGDKIATRLADLSTPNSNFIQFTERKPKIQPTLDSSSLFANTATQLGSIQKNSTISVIAAEVQALLSADHASEIAAKNNAKNEQIDFSNEQLGAYIAQPTDALGAQTNTKTDDDLLLSQALAELKRAKKLKSSRTNKPIKVPKVVPKEDDISHTESASPLIAASDEVTQSTQGKAKSTSNSHPKTPKEADDDIEQFAFVRDAKNRKRLRIGLTIGILVLLLLLAFQVAYFLRNTIAAAFPASRGALLTMCQIVGCKISLPAQITAISSEADELHSLPRPNTYELSLLLHNRSQVTQAWPHIQLTLKNDKKQAILTRVFAPSAYLRGTEFENGFGGNQDQAVKIYFELDQIKASDYVIMIFYP